MNFPLPSGGVPAQNRGTLTLLVITCLVSVLQMVPGIGPLVENSGQLSHFAVFKQGEVWRLVTYMFMHAGGGHLLFNALALWMFGPIIEQQWTTRSFVLFYLWAGVLSGAFCVFMPLYSPIVGASGALLALLTVYAWYFPRNQILFFFFIPMPVWLAVVITGVVSLLLSQTGAGGVAHFIHLGGIVVGVVYMALKTQFPRYMQRLADQRSAARKAQFTIVSGRQQASESRAREKVDALLKKISEKGMHSLSEAERQELEAESKKLRR
jgi:membrane associated rhomboid family serine protease